MGRTDKGYVYQPWRERDLSVGRKKKLLSPKEESNLVTLRRSTTKPQRLSVKSGHTPDMLGSYVKKSILHTASFRKFSKKMCVRDNISISYSFKDRKYLQYKSRS